MTTRAIRTKTGPEHFQTFWLGLKKIRNEQASDRSNTNESAGKIVTFKRLESKTGLELN